MRNQLIPTFVIVLNREQIKYCNAILYAFVRSNILLIQGEAQMMTADDPKRQLQEVENFKRLAFFGIAISTVATLTAIVFVPMMYNYMQHIQSSLQNELDFCRHRTDGLWTQYSRVGHIRFNRSNIDI
jgi:hypothetical protein